MYKKSVGRVMGALFALIMGVSSPMSAYAQAEEENIELLVEEPEDFDVLEDVEEGAELCIEGDFADEASEENEEEAEPSQEENEEAPVTEWLHDEYTVVYHASSAPTERFRYASREVVYTYDNKDDLLEQGIFTKDGFVQTEWVTEEGAAFAVKSEVYDVAATVKELVAFMDTMDVQKIDLYCHWEPTYYTVHFEGIEDATPDDSNYGLRDGNVLDLYYREVLDLSWYIYHRKGYDFKSWTTEIDGKVRSYSKTDKVKMLTNVSYGEVVLKANWTPRTNKISYQLDGATLKNAPTSYRTGSDIKLAVPKKPYSTFMGWEIDVNEEGLSEEDSSKVFDIETNTLKGKEYENILCGDLVLYPIFKEQTYSVVFCDPEGKAYEKQPEGFDRIYYPQSISFNEAAKALYANAKEEGFGGTIVGFSTTLGGKVTYSVNGSYSKLADADTELKLYAVIEKNTYSIEYSVTEDVTLNKPVYTYTSGKKVTLPKASRTGYKFVGWNVLTGSEDSFSYKKDYAVSIKKDAAENVVLEPVFTPIVYKVYLSYNAPYVTNQDGKKRRGKRYLGRYSYDGEYLGKRKHSDDDEDYWEEEDEEEYDILGRTGYNLIGYSTNPKATTEEECLQGGYEALTTKGSVTVYMIWENIGYSVSCENAYGIRLINYDSEYADWEDMCMDPLYVNRPYGSKYVLPKPHIPGYKFLGYRMTDYYYYGDDEFIPKVITDKKGYVTAIKADNWGTIELDAYFIEIGYSLKLDPNGGVYTDAKGEHKKPVYLCSRVYSTEHVDYVEDALDAARSCTKREGYVLRGLYLDKKGKKPLPVNIEDLAQEPDKAVTVYAVWDKVSKKKGK